MNFDILIRNGQLLDGTGSDPRRADIGILDGKVASIEAPASAEASDTIDATDRVVAPGFVDIHSHGDLILAWPSDKRLELLKGRIAQGITTEVIGNCGLGATPLFGEATALLPAINGWMSPEVYEWKWGDFTSYFDHLEDSGLPMNVGSLVGHGPLRLGAMGLASGESETKARERMAAALEEALDQGALGLSAGLIYPPGMYTSTDELIYLAGILRRYNGVFTCHVRGSSETLLPAVDELIHIGRETGIRVHHSHAEAVGRAHWSKLATFLEKEAEARRQGIRLSADMFPHAVAATMMLAIYPPWSLEGGLPRLLERLRVDEIRERIRHDIETVAPEWSPWRKGGWPHNLVKAVGWETVQARPSNYWSTTARAFGCARSVSRRGACSGGRVRRRMALRRYPPSSWRCLSTTDFRCERGWPSRGGGSVEPFQRLLVAPRQPRLGCCSSVSSVHGDVRQIVHRVDTVFYRGADHAQEHVAHVGACLGLEEERVLAMPL